MAAKQVIEILEHGAFFHTQLSHEYKRLGSAATTEELRAALTFLSQHEEHVASAIREYIADAAPLVRDSWVRWEPPLDVDHLLEELKQRKVLHLEDLAEVAARMDDSVEQIFRHVGERSLSNEVREAFEALTSLEEEERRRVLHGLSEF